MKKNGFTLVELLAVLLLLSFVFAILYTSIKSVLSYSNDKIYKAQLKEIFKLSYDYTLLYPELLPTSNDSLLITLADLKKEGLTGKNIIDTRNNEAFSDDTFISVQLYQNGMSTSELSKREGNYIYTINFNNNENKPVINLSNESLLPQLNGQFVLPQITSVIVNNTDMKNSFDEIIIISKDDKIVESVDTSTFGIYSISYTVKNETYGCSNKVIKVSIVDDIPPTLSATFATTTNISLNQVDSYNLYEGITCSDNDKCEIYINGIVEKEVGTYTLKYFAKDPKGNVSSPIIRIIKVA